MNKEALLRRIQELSFVKTECELFLDTHPDCKAALDYYRRTVAELMAANTEYNNLYGPLVAAEVTGEGWSWIEGPWPWQLEKKEDGKRGGR